MALQPLHDRIIVEAAAKEQGKWKELHEKAEKQRQDAEAKAARLELENRRNEVREQVRSYLSEHHKDYVGTEKYILPLIDFALDTAAEDITKRIKATADTYVKDNPRGRPAPPPPPPGGKHGGGGGPLKITGAASRF